MKWIDIHEVAEAIVRNLVGKLTYEDVSEYEGVSFHKNEDMSEFVEQLLCSDNLHTWVETQRRYDYQKAFRKLKKTVWRRRTMRLMGVLAGAACIAGICMVVFYKEQKQQERRMWQLELARETKAILVQASGEQIHLDASTREMQGDVEMMLTADSTGIYYNVAGDLAQTDMVVYNTLIVPRGGIYRLTLADGTVVWLNSDSQLEFPVNFNGDMREVFLRGEAYFYVRTDSLKPFVVHTELGKVRVLGTEFDVKYYPEEATMMTTLVEGSVSFSNENVDEVRIVPGCQLVFNAGDWNVSVRRVNVRYYVGWKDDILSFRSECLADIMRILSRWYDVTIIFENEELKDLVFSGYLDKYDDINEFFKLFEMSSPTRFETEGRYVYVRDADE